MARGDHLFVRRWVKLVPYEHHGIDMGDGTVVHLSPAKDAPIAFRDTTDRFSIRRDSMADFAAGQTLRTVKHQSDRSPEQIAATAESLIGNTGYDLLEGNCEHFASLCATGKSSSRQVDSSLAAVSVVTSAATKVFWAVSSKVGAGWGMRAATKVHPAALLADGIEIVVLAATCQSQSDPAVSRRLARHCGTLTAAGVGALIAGPAGAAVGMATHASSTAIADGATKVLGRLLAKRPENQPPLKPT